MKKISVFKHAQAGVTLVELMVGLTVGLIITGGAMTIMFSNQKLLINKEAADRTQEGFRFAASTITRMVRQATSFDKPSSNNELIVNFDTAQRDCLGQNNNSSTNTLKLDTNNQLVCILDKDPSRTYVLAKNIGGLQFSYGIQQSGAVTYRPYYSGTGTTVDTTVDSVWNNITSVLTRISLIQAGNTNQLTLDFIATSHQHGSTGSLSSGGTSTIGSGSGSGSGTTPITIPPLQPIPQPTPLADESNITQGTVPDSSVSGVIPHILGLLSVDYFAPNATETTPISWLALANSTSPTVIEKGTDIKITLSKTKYDLSKWSLVFDNGTPVPLPATNSSATSYSYTTPSGNGKAVTVSLIEKQTVNKVSTNVTRSTIKFITSN